MSLHYYVLNDKWIIYTPNRNYNFTFWYGMNQCSFLFTWELWYTTNFTSWKSGHIPLYLLILLILLLFNFDFLVLFLLKLLLYFKNFMMNVQYQLYSILHISSNRYYIKSHCVSYILFVMFLYLIIFLFFWHRICHYKSKITQS